MLKNKTILTLLGLGNVASDGGGPGRLGDLLEVKCPGKGKLPVLVIGSEPDALLAGREPLEFNSDADDADLSLDGVLSFVLVGGKVVEAVVE